MYYTREGGVLKAIASRAKLISIQFCHPKWDVMGGRRVSSFILIWIVTFHFAVRSKAVLLSFILHRDLRCTGSITWVTMRQCTKYITLHHCSWATVIFYLKFPDTCWSADGAIYSAFSDKIRWRFHCQENSWTLNVVLNYDLYASLIVN